MVRNSLRCILTLDIHLILPLGELQKFSDKLPREKLIMFEFENARGVAVAAFHPQVDHLVAGKQFLPKEKF